MAAKSSPVESFAVQQMLDNKSNAYGLMLRVWDDITTDWMLFRAVVRTTTAAMHQGTEEHNIKEDYTPQ